MMKNSKSRQTARNEEIEAPRKSEVNCQEPREAPQKTNQAGVDPTKRIQCKT